MASYLGNNPDNIIKVRKGNYRYVATSGQTAFTGTDSNSLSMSINTADVEVYLNGVLLDQTDYTATISTVTLGAGATINDIVEVITNTDFQVASLYTKEEVDTKVATAITNLVGTAGSALNTLGELSDALNDDANYAATITTALGTKANTSSLGTLATLSPTGTASASTFLAGDGSYKTVSVTPTAVSSQANSATDYFALPSGTTAQRPVSPSNGMIRYNTTLNKFEVYQNNEWLSYSLTYTTEYLVVAGGGGANSGGGGAGGYVTGSASFTSGATYPIVIGAGGVGVAQNTGIALTNGNDSTFLSSTAVGGGQSGYTDNSQNGKSGGSGGGGAGDGRGASGGAGTSGQGNAGAGTGGGSPYPGGGGGGAGAAGTAGSGSQGGSGGIGLNWQSLGTFYAGGGGAGGAFTASVPGTGGNGGGGNGGASGGGSGTSGSANRGGGGGGFIGYQSTANVGGSGGSGVVIVRYLGGQKGTGGTITSASGYTYHTFTSSGSYIA